MSDESADDQSSLSSLSSDFSDVTPLNQMQMNTGGKNSCDVPDDSDNEVDKFRQLLLESDYALLIKECKKEYQKLKPSRQQIKTLLKKSFANRRKEIEKIEAEGVLMMSSIMINWPCFQQGKYVSILSIKFIPI